MGWAFFRIVLVGCTLVFGLGHSKVFAEDVFESLRLELSLIGSQIEDLRLGLLSPEVRSLAPSDAGIALLRLDALEAKLRSTVGRVEAIEFHLQILSKDATNRMMEFSSKLEQLENKNTRSDLKLSQKNDEVEKTEEYRDEISNETLAFDKALLSFTSKDFGTALEYFESFNSLYPQSINIDESYYRLGQTNMALNDSKRAASAFLDSFSRVPSGPFAWKSLLGLAIALGNLGQMEQGCLTLGELKSRFPEKASQNLDQILIAEEQLKCSL